MFGLGVAIDVNTSLYKYGASLHILNEEATKTEGLFGRDVCSPTSGEIRLCLD